METNTSEILYEGKTKIIKKVPDRDNVVILENKDDITAFDDPSKTKKFSTKGRFATNTTCRVFELLKAANIPVAYEEQISPLEFVAPKCQMIPLEVVARRYAVGSYLKRFPNLIDEGRPPYRFHDLQIEFFLKTTNGRLSCKSGKEISVDVSKGEEDPFLMFYEGGDVDEKGNFEGCWKLYHSKKPSWDPTAFLQQEIKAKDLFVKMGVFRSRKEIIDAIEEITRRTFLVLESAWAQQNMRLIDFKIEFGWSQTGMLLVADVIDNDSWRLRDAKWKELSKESFRQGEELDEVERKYGAVSEMTNNFRLPKQCLILWTGSNKDEMPKAPVEYYELIDVERVIQSGHKSPQKCLDELEKILAKHPDGGVIIVKVGRSNGLGPILAARTSWPVIAVPATMKEFPEDIWSSVRMPSDVPLLTAWPEENAVIAAMNILAQKNPAIYACRQYEIENLDLK